MTEGVVWFHRDLRLEDNPAWDAATAAHDEVVTVFVVEAGFDECRRANSARSAPRPASATDPGPFAASGVILRETYPTPIIDHTRALETYKRALA